MSNYQDKNNNLDEENELQLIIGRNPVIEALKANKLIEYEQGSFTSGCYCYGCVCGVCVSGGYSQHCT